MSRNGCPEFRVAIEYIGTFEDLRTGLWEQVQRMVVQCMMAGEIASFGFREVEVGQA